MRTKFYIQPKLDLLVGKETARLEHVTVFNKPKGSGVDELYGNLGQDLVARFKSFTLDFSRMIFSLGPPL